MAKLKVLNVGQGDSMILRTNKGCKFHDETILIDLGPGSYNIARNIGPDEKVHIFITHHDSDHVGGMKFFFHNKFRQIREITVPLYQNEITLIAKAILSLKGIGVSKDCGEFISALNEIVNNQIFLSELLRGSSDCPKLSVAYDGKAFCDHIRCLNPPMMPEIYEWWKELQQETLFEILDELFDAEFAQDLKRYVSNDWRGLYELDEPLFDSILLRGWEEQRMGREIEDAKKSFVVNFVVENISLLREFNKKPTRKKLGEIYREFTKSSHDVSMVLKVSDSENSFLLTGDASARVFRRLMREGKDISADYLKIPHHGSKKNMKDDILDAIKPQTAIISHKNGRFGKAKDAHPNKEVLSMLQRKKIKILLTNDVEKEGIVFMRRENHCHDYYVEIVQV